MTYLRSSQLCGWKSITHHTVVLGTGGEYIMGAELLRMELMLLLKTPHMTSLIFFISEDRCSNNVPLIKKKKMKMLTRHQICWPPKPGPYNYVESENWSSAVWTSSSSGGFSVVPQMDEINSYLYCFLSGLRVWHIYLSGLETSLLSLWALLSI